REYRHGSGWPRAGKAYILEASLAGAAAAAALAAAAGGVLRKTFVCAPLATSTLSSARRISHASTASTRPARSTRALATSSALAGAGARKSTSSDDETWISRRGSTQHSAYDVSTSTSVEIAPPCSVPKRLHSAGDTRKPN